MDKVTLTPAQFNTDQLIIITYKGGSAGKFLINCLALASNAVLQDRILADQQCDGELTPEDKLWVLLNKIEKTDGKWNDLTFNSYRFFGQTFVRYLEKYPGMSKFWHFNKVVARSIDQGHRFFIEAHSLNCAESFLSVWPNARIIYFENADEFVSKTEPGYLEESAEYRHKLNELEKQHAARLNLIMWDPNCYFEPELFYNNLKNLYQQLGLNDFNLELVKEFYEAWAAKRLR